MGHWLGKILGKWLATEALKSILDFGFDQLNLEEIYAAYKIGNEGSKKVLIKCGFEFYREKKEFDSLLIKEESLIEMIKKDALI